MKESSFKTTGIFNGNSIFARVFIPIMALLIFQAAIYGVIFWRGNVIDHIEQNAIDIFNEHAVNSSQNMNINLSHIAQSLHEDTELITADIEEAIKSYNLDYDDVFINYYLNQRLLLDTAPRLLNMLNHSDVNGIFMILDGPLNSASFPDTPPRAGIYLRRSDLNVVVGDNGHILLERGISRLSRELNVARDVGWEAGYSFSDGQSAENDFFFSPINAARSQGAKEKSSFYGKWCGCYSFFEDNSPALSYSVPIITEDGSVIGVLGMDINLSTLTSLMPYQNLSHNGEAAYILGLSTDNGESYSYCASNGPIYRYHFADAQYISPDSRLEDNSDIFRLSDSHGCSFFGVEKPLSLYKEDTPFANERWALIGLAQSDVLFYFSKRLSDLAAVSLLITLAVGFAGIWLVAKLFTAPISRLIQQLRTSNPLERIYLRKIGINEIDELTVSIENLSTRIADSSERIARIFSIAPTAIGVFEYDRRSPSVFCSSGLCRLLNWHETSENEYVFIDRHEFESRLIAIDKNLLRTKQMQFSVTTDSKATRWLRADTVSEGSSVIGAITDITEEIAAKRRIEFERDYDTLTGLYNLRAFTSKYNSIFAADKLETACLIMWDLDNLKHINDTYGHDFGDRYIQTFAQCLELFSEYNALVARRSGDEFYVFLHGHESKDEINDIIASIWEKISAQSILLPDGSRYRIRVSGGIAWCPEDTSDRDELLRFADFAMYSAKHGLKGSISGFDLHAYRDNAHILDGYEVISGLIEGELVRFAMQPIVSAKDGSVYGYEMLMRPQIPGESYSPLDILKMAQIHSKLYHIERLSFFKGMQTFVEHIIFKSIPENSRVFLNSLANQSLSAKDIEAFENSFAKYLNRIVIEITEGEQASDEYSVRKTTRANKWSAGIAIDDYGTGYNSESTLIALHPDIVKVDMSILRGIDKDTNRQTMLESLISYAQRFDVAILAEGIETEQELETVIARGVDYIQGYYVSRPEFDPAPISQSVVNKITELAQKYS